MTFGSHTHIPLWINCIVLALGTCDPLSNTGGLILTLALRMSRNTTFSQFPCFPLQHLHTGFI